MSYTTRCPACGTMFRVVPDQLKLSDGWVRCGHCADVFDATLYLEEWVPPAPQPSAPVPVSPVDVDETVPAALFQDTEPAALPVAATRPSEAADAGVVPAAPSSGPDDAPGDRLMPPVSQEAAVPPPLAAAGIADPSVPDAMAHVDAVETVGAGGPAAVTEDFQSDLSRFAVAAGHAVEAPPPTEIVPAEPPPIAFREPEAVVAEQEAGEPGFVRQARRQAFWRSPAVRASLSVLALLLGALLFGQWALHDRDRLAARHPDLAPLLAQACGWFDCRIAAPRDIHAVVIDSSNLVRRLGNFYAFDVVIKNTADLPVALPALELSLTDTRDQVIARRVFMPAELPGAPALLAAQTSVPLSLRLSISDAGGVPMAGYRALVFYP